MTVVGDLNKNSFGGVVGVKRDYHELRTRKEEVEIPLPSRASAVKKQGAEDGACAVAAVAPGERRNQPAPAEGRIRKAVLCQRCGSRVLQLGTAPFRRQLFLPSMRRKPAQADGDVLQKHWLVDDMFIFENSGFTKDVVCADCEIGPIGWHCLDDKNSFCVALERVLHE
ncbi:guanine nucleotide exchange factor MSS4-like [Choloepus didactylus]|uniref:guanine nucleotide exchange factor MSS4-like n=1 Tax=Choloepus didactylus TaxID=27675 RepID=UPI00189D2CC1|nr:guanine nucleotide exchange factor MSS4-like [Choloepus didactylus]